MDVVPYPFEIMQTPDRVTMLYEYASAVRRISLGGTPYPGDDMPLYNGLSAGHWDGATLVVETTDIRADTQLDDTDSRTATRCGSRSAFGASTRGRSRIASR